MKVSSIERGAGTFIFPLPDAVLQTGDHLVIQDTPDRLKEFETRMGEALYSLGDEEAPPGQGSSPACGRPADRRGRWGYGEFKFRGWSISHKKVWKRLNWGSSVFLQRG
jgi:hypothetical protein